MGRHVIVGAGTIGSALAARLAGAGEEVVVVSRRGAPAAEGAAVVALDASDAAALHQVATRASVLYNCANPSSYRRWEREWPPLATSLLGAAASSGAVLVTLSNLYGYGPVAHAMHETDPLAATSTKGRIRAAMWLTAKVAHDAGSVRATEIRASDFFGPGVTTTGHLGVRVVPKILDHETISLVGDVDAPHSWTYVDDLVRALEVAGRDQRAWGRAWHAPTSAPRSSRAAVRALAEAAGLDAPPVRRIPWGVLRAASAVAPSLRGLSEIRYQFDAPFVLDSTSFTSTFGEPPTSFETACAATVGWWRRRRGFPLAPISEAGVAR